VIRRLKKQWREFIRAKPGQRFQDRYQRSRQSRAERSRLIRLLQPAAAVLLILIGLVLVFIPGPAILFFLAAAGLLANESKKLARLLDRLELKLRAWRGRASKWWKRAPAVARYALLMIAIAAVGGAGYTAYRVVFAG
jgi:hypothetical protein